MRPGCSALNVHVPRSPSGVIGKHGGDIILASKSRPLRPPCAATGAAYAAAADTARAASATHAGARSGEP